MPLLIQDLPLQERPRERARSLGVEALSIHELLVITLSRGSRNTPVSEIATQLLKKYKTLTNLADTSLIELGMIKGLGHAKALQLMASFELGKRWSTEVSLKKTNLVLSSESAFLMVKNYLRNKKKEHLMLFALDTRNRLITKPQLLSVGTLNASIVHPREVYGFALNLNAAGILLAHNHPSGDSNPSAEDLRTTESMVQAGGLIGIKLIDHIIVVDDGFYSIRENNPELFLS